MKRGKCDFVLSLSRQRSIQFLVVFGFLYIVMVALEAPFVYRTGFSAVKTEEFVNEPLGKPIVLQSKRDLEENEAPIRPLEHPQKAANQPSLRRMTEYKSLSSLIFHGNSTKDGVSGIQRSAMEAFEVGKKLWDDLESGKAEIENEKARENRNETCPLSISLTGSQFVGSGKIIVLPCGLTLGSHITIVGKPRKAHPEQKTKISLLKEGQYTMVSQFMMELQGLKAVDGEDPPRILHFNPRLKGDWSGRPVIEQNTCYRMQWGSSLRCEGWKSRADEETVDSQPKCEKWIRDDNDHSEESKAAWWLKRLTGRTNKVTLDWPFPFVEEKLFVLTLRAGLEGYHISVDGKHITSFPYRIGYTLEDATGLSLNGDVDVESIHAASLPASHPSNSPQQFLQMSNLWQAPSLPEGPVEVFIGILSAGNHFAERMAVRKSWMQHRLIKSSIVVGRFFVALHARTKVNVQLKKEAEFFGDIVIVPYMDNYDLVVLKTVAIAEYGVNTASAKYIMKGDDDTFVNLDAVIKEIKKVPDGKSFYIGNINYYHKPLRSGKWAVTYEEWPEEDYPPYANGPGYIITSDIANFIVSQFKESKLRLFKMEDVSMGMWVEKFNSTRPVEYVHSLKYCQFGCIEGYYTAHYQSPRQMICLWNNLRLKGRAQCCNMR